MTNSSELWDKKQKNNTWMWAHCALSCASQEAAFSVLPCENKALFLNFLSLTHLLLIVMERKNQTAELLEEAPDRGFQSGSVRKVFIHRTLLKIINK